MQQLLFPVALLLLIVGLVPPIRAQDENDLVNLDHLAFLTEPVTIDGREMAIVHIYSEYPDYEWVDAAGEGIAAVDDVTRAAVVYLQEYERTGDELWLELARRCLEFVLYMQAEDGEFYNFIRTAAGEINETGNTSFKSLGWWAMRALWSLGEGVRVFDTVDPDYADELAEAYLLTEAALDRRIRNYGEMIELHGFDIPAWIPDGEPRYAAIGLLGMSAFYQARPNETTAGIITQVADGIAAYQLGTPDRYPWGMHPSLSSAPGFWHDWGAHMVHGLAVAGMTLDRPDWIESAAADADSFMLRHLVFERFREMAVVPFRRNQIAYGTNMLVQGYLSLYEATGEERYARYAGLAASWYFGSNMAGVQMYDSETGRVLDGIDGPVSWRVNRNSGAESTIEGLLSMQALAAVPEAQPYLQAESVDGTHWQILEAESGERIEGAPRYVTTTWTGETMVSGGRYVALGDGDVMELTVEIEREDTYLLYVAHERQVEQAGSEEASATRLDTPPTIDGDLGEWADVPALASNSRQQFLRGAGLWQGPDVDSHTVQIGWDDENLYLAADVRDPEHDQQYTLSDVWHGDTLWIYMTSSPDERLLSAKLTLAQTPDGPQLWNWVNTGFAEGGELAWQPTDHGYIYEAAIPWTTLRVDAPQAGATFGLEVGRGIGGNSFMDLTGRDPDIAANLLPVTLTDAESEASTVVEAPSPVFLRVQFADGDPLLVAESTSPDRSHFWLDAVWRDPVHLPPGTYTLRYSYAGASADDTSQVDAFYLQPATGWQTYRLDDGTFGTLMYDTTSGEATWTEATP